MARRPRLIEEGVPIGFSTTFSVSNDNDHFSDHEMHDAEIPQPTAKGMEQQKRHHPHNDIDDKKPPIISSLFLASSSSRSGKGGFERKFKHHPKQMHATHIVIGKQQDHPHDVDGRYNAIYYDRRHSDPIRYNDNYYNEISQMQPGHEIRPQQPDTTAFSSYTYDSTAMHHHIQEQQQPHPQQHHHYHHSWTSAAAVESSTPASLVSAGFMVPPNPPPPPSRCGAIIRTHIEIGADERITEKMEGVQDQSIKTPLIVMDGANVAYAYGLAMDGGDGGAGGSFPRPDVRGIRVACDYFLGHSSSSSSQPDHHHSRVRILVVLPQSWFRSHPKYGSNNKNNHHHPTAFLHSQPQQIQILQQLQAEGKLVAAPPTGMYGHDIANKNHGKYGIVTDSNNFLFSFTPQNKFVE
jgi:hypothetical protein